MKPRLRLQMLHPREHSGALMRRERERERKKWLSFRSSSLRFLKSDAESRSAQLSTRCGHMKGPNHIETSLKCSMVTWCVSFATLSRARRSLYVEPHALAGPQRSLRPVGARLLCVNDATRAKHSSGLARHLRKQSAKTDDVDQRVAGRLAQRLDEQTAHVISDEQTRMRARHLDEIAPLDALEQRLVGREEMLRAKRDVGGPH